MAKTVILKGVPYVISKDNESREDGGHQNLGLLHREYDQLIHHKIHLRVLAPSLSSIILFSCHLPTVKPIHIRGPLPLDKDKSSLSANLGAV